MVESCVPEASLWAYELASIPREREREREEGVQSPYIRKCGREQISTWRIWSTALFFMVQLNCQKKKKGLLKCEKKGSRPSTASGHHYWEMLAEWQWDL